MKIGFDFGGSLIKISLMISSLKKLNEDILKTIEKYQTHQITQHEECYINMLIKKDDKDIFFEFLEKIESFIEQDIVYGTGGGAISFEKEIRKKLKNRKFEIINEFTSIVKGIKKFKIIIDKFIYTLSLDQKNDKIKKDYLPVDNLYPFFLVNIGTGISINLVTAKKAEYISGTALGGQSFIGFYKQFFPNLIYSDIMEKIDTFFLDKKNECFKKNYLEYNLQLFFKEIDLNDEEIKINAIFGFFYSVLNNICLIAHQLAKNKKIEYVLFIGNFLKNNSSQIIITNIFDKMNKLNMTEELSITPLFLEIEGFLGSFYCLNKKK